MVTINIDTGGLDPAKLKGKEQAVGNALVQFIEQVTIDAWRYSREEAPRKTGILKTSIMPDLSTLPQLCTRVFSGLESAGYVHNGTQPHDIWATRARALRFVLNGQIIYAKHVKHPGTTANPFFERAADRIKSDLPSLFSRYVGGVL